MTPGVQHLALRTDDELTRQEISRLNDENTMHSTTAERTLLSSLRGGCMAPVAARARIQENQLCMDAVVLSGDGKKRLDVSVSDLPEHAKQLGIAAAEQLLADGAKELIAASRK